LTTCSKAARILSSSVDGQCGRTTRLDALYASTSLGWAPARDLLIT
jgi:hypothetical protein